MTQCVAIYDYVGDKAQSQISFKKEEVITIKKKAGGWWYGSTASGSEGYFPSTYVKPKEEDPEPAPAIVHKKKPSMPVNPMAALMNKELNSKLGIVPTTEPENAEDSGSDDDEGSSSAQPEDAVAAISEVPSPEGSARSKMAGIIAPPQTFNSTPAPAPAPAAAAPSVWKEETDPATGKVYYYNPSTNTTQWKKPVDAWKAVLDPRTNKYYYFNEWTNQTSWTAPAETQQRAPPAPPAVLPTETRGRQSTLTRPESMPVMSMGQFERLKNQGKIPPGHRKVGSQDTAKPTALSTMPVTQSEYKMSSPAAAPVKKEKTMLEKKEHVTEMVKFCANYLVRGELCGLKRAGERDYMKRLVFCDQDLKKLCWVKDGEDRGKKLKPKHVLDLAHILNTSDGPPTKSAKVDQKKADFKTCTFTLNSQKTADSVDLFFLSVSVKEGWLHAINVIMSGGTCVGDGSVKLDPSMVLNAPPPTPGSVPRGQSVKNEGSIGFQGLNDKQQKQTVTYDYQDGAIGGQKEGYKADAHGVSSQSPHATATKSADDAKRKSTMARMKLQGHQSIPEELANDIRNFGMKGYANKFFQVSKHAKKGGLFGGGKVSLGELLSFSKTPLKASLLSSVGDELQQEAVKMFHAILEYCGDLGSKAKPPGSHDQLADIVSHGLFNEQLQDELVCQLVKQTSHNPSAGSCEHGWELLMACVDAFRPSKVLSSIVFEHAWAHCQQHNAVGAMALYLQSKLPISRGAVHKEGTADATGQVMDEDLLHAIKGRFLPKSIFKSSLEGVLTFERFVRRKAELEMAEAPEAPEDSEVPFVVQLLTRAVMQLGGEKKEGIFRVAGDASSKQYFEKKMEQCDYSSAQQLGKKGCLKDPVEAADLLKDFFRRLTEPLFPPALYSECIEAGKKIKDGSRAVKVALRLPETNRKTLVYILNFLRQLAHHEEVTKMGQGNLALVFAPNLVRNNNADVMNMASDADYANRFLEHLIASDDPAIS